MHHHYLTQLDNDGKRTPLTAPGGVVVIGATLEHPMGDIPLDGSRAQQDYTFDFVLTVGSE
ncbi:hypothetical protein EYF80_038967 [Liparis tanakae]|uniref:Uncharacterized protein n=1 Tax=Liparis tanakae TaxID=230148 RepID=A0A4Z2GC40_9TELE|nr:hypothetical protein EYF80_038967 [Liparis tanakae]